MSYRGNSEQDALKNLTQNVRDRLKKAGSSVYFEAIAQDKTSHVPAMILEIHGERETFKKK